MSPAPKPKIPAHLLYRRCTGVCGLYTTEQAGHYHTNSGKIIPLAKGEAAPAEYAG